MGNFLFGNDKPLINLEIIGIRSSCSNCVKNSERKSQEELNLGDEQIKKINTKKKINS